ncbi:TIGR00300 family protein [Methanobrevibacter sp. DSM 116169]|uniref:ornithine cyclodeaminase n=1 Tax=Methanobrevibacter sp. DSM 116169 TaxID=3242727 RepID=UPI0038FC546A
MNKRTIELSGHIIDSLALPKTMDIIMDMGGDFDILEFDVGKRKSDISRAKILVSANDPKLLNNILNELTGLGASIAELKDAELIKAPKDKVAPEGFYSTSNLKTHVLNNSNWLVVEDIEMDCVIAIDEDNKKAYCKPILDIKEGESIVVGNDGIKVTPLQRSRGKKGTFEFMNSEVSSEKPLMSIVDNIASEIKEIKERGGKIAIVGGPAIVHTGSANMLADLIKSGYIDVILAGNALATHDIEGAIYGTSLGVDLESGEIVSHGHTHHMRAINKINNSGSIKDAVLDGTLKKGIMYECVKNDVPFILAGSIRDDGPLPDTITDISKSQKLMREYAQEVDMVIMIATMLHSIAVGNLLPAHVKTVCVDINPATATKLSDRGSSQAVSIVTDIGAFLPVLYESLNK